MAIFLVKLFHTFVFLVLAVCTLFLLYCALFNRRNRWTLVAFILVAVEGVALLLNGFRCPLADLAERLGAENGSVTGIFLPPFLAGRVFQVCTPLATVAILALGIRMIVDRRGGRRPGARAAEAGAGKKNEARERNP